MSSLIHSYTRAQAISDGVLMDISQLASEAGFRYPVAVTSTVWAACVAVHPEDVGQDEPGRLWDILNVLRDRIHSSGDAQTIYFAVLVAHGGKRPRPVELKAHCGPGDNFEPVITIMVPHED